MFQKILIATDGSEHSFRSTQHAVQLAEKFDGTIDIVYIVDGRTAKTDVLNSTDKYEIEKKRNDKINAVKQMVTDAQIECEAHILHGEPGPTIVDFANEHNFDCVVVGSRGLNKLQTMVLGSVSHKVAKRVECPVLIVK
ncbi:MULTISPECIES: universal stress protein [unclassified Oceanobacillus]|uniref:universal stress protein n=1 Tax=unclassified Oceanobacillus TaxID=2630292 RepID=UPI001BE5AA9C|nr:MULTISPECIES: universal stress protein [unclassified Oceanobacillus]MBT2601111.1 universal stress protein [Oceanobacillus sp. ISL-74]MBT2652337.1 universal stress protein [Oceanobacillus sp. ISL-73]